MISENLLTLFEAQVPVGRVVTLYLTSGREWRGTLVAVNREAITIDTGNGLAVLHERLLGGWHVDNNFEVLSPPQAPQITISQSQEEKVAEPSEDASAINLRLAEITARYDLGTQQMTLRAPDPHFDLPLGSRTLSYSLQIELRKALDRARNQYEYSIRVSEPSRLVNIAAQLRVASEGRSGVRGLRLIIGELLIAANRHHDAIEQCQEEWRTSALPEAAFGVAYSALQLNDLPRACSYLAQFIASSRADPPAQEWFVLVGLVSRLKAYDVWQTILQSCARNSASASQSTLLVEGLTYCLVQAGRGEMASRIVQAVIEAGLTDDLLMAAWRDLVASIDTSSGQVWIEYISREKQDAEADTERRRLASIESRRRQIQSQLRLTPNGKIRSLHRNGEYGFLTDLSGSDRWFHIKDVRDPGLAKDLIELPTGTDIPVVFEPYEHDGRLRARELRYPRTIDHVLENARALHAAGKRTQAKVELRSVLDAFPGHQAASELLQELASSSVAHGPRPATVAGGDGYFARASRAQLVDRDLVKAEALYREAIEHDESKDGPVKGLAMLLAQQDRKEESIALIEAHLPQLSDKKPALNILATTYSHTSKHREAVAVLERVKAFSAPSELPGLLKRMAFGYYHLRDYSAAERLLSQALEMTPGDATALRMKATLAEALESGVYTEADAVFDQGIFTQVSYNVSPTLKFALERCDFSGVVDSVRATRNFTQETLISVGKLIDLQRGRPRERARYLLTYARLMQELGSDDDAQFRSTLFAYACATGDSAASQPKPLDVVRAYYAEALFLQEQWDAIVNRVVQYLRSFVVKSEELLPIDGKSAPLDDTVALVCSQASPPKGMWDGVLDMCVISRTVAQNLIPRLWRNTDARASSIEFLGINAESPRSEEAYVMAWDVARQRRAKEANEWFEGLVSQSRTTLTAATCESTAKQLEARRVAWLPTIDQQRLGRVIAILHTARSVYRQIDFEERERSYHACMTQADSLLQDIEENPTRFAVGGLHPFLERVKEQLNGAFEEVLKDTAPRVALALSVDEVTPDAHGKARLQLRVSNGKGSQPIAGVSIRLESESGECWPARSSFDYPDVIRGDDSAVIECDVTLTSAAVEARAISVGASLTYRSRKGEQVTVGEQKVSLRLYPASEFLSIRNPFAPYAEGGPVREKTMFFGREADIDNIATAIIESDSKCVVIYGQKRAGKSSVLHHLQERLNGSDHVVAVPLSLGIVAGEFSLQALFYRMARQLCDTLSAIVDAGNEAPVIDDVVYADFAENSTIAFLDFLRRYRTQCKQLEGWRSRRLVFLIDEFTYLYTMITTNSVTRDVMKTWKALLEEGQFSAVLVGQDVMPKFKREFPNEFGVTQDIRLSHLPDADARRLLEDPIRIGGASGESRYRGKALERALALTSGSAYYSQMFGNRLVDYMNDVKASYVTEADVDRVARDMVTGAEALARDKFDNLITAGDHATETHPEQDVVRTLAAIARGSQGGLCGRHVLIDEGIPSLDGILSDLVAREVVDEPKQGYFRIHVGLFGEWLLSHYRMEIPSIQMVTPR